MKVMRGMIPSSKLSFGAAVTKQSFVLTTYLEIGPLFYPTLVLGPREDSSVMLQLLQFIWLKPPSSILLW